jgi:hypothetical protein
LDSSRLVYIKNLTAHIVDRESLFQAKETIPAVYLQEEIFMWRILNFLAGFIIGIMLGASFILISTPQSGKELKEVFRREFATRKAELESKLLQAQAIE